MTTTQKTVEHLVNTQVFHVMPQALTSFVCNLKLSGAELSVYTELYSRSSRNIRQPFRINLSINGVARLLSAYHRSTIVRAVHSLEDLGLLRIESESQIAVLVPDEVLDFANQNDARLARRALAELPELSPDAEACALPSPTPLPDPKPTRKPARSTACLNQLIEDIANQPDAPLRTATKMLAGFNEQQLRALETSILELAAHGTNAPCWWSAVSAGLSTAAISDVPSPTKIESAPIPASTLKEKASPSSDVARVLSPRARSVVYQVLQREVARPDSKISVPLRDLFREAIFWLEKGWGVRFASPLHGIRVAAKLINKNRWRSPSGAITHISGECEFA